MRRLTSSNVAVPANCLGRASGTLEKKTVVSGSSARISANLCLTLRSESYPDDSLRKTVVGVRKSEDVEIERGSRAGRVLFDVA